MNSVEDLKALASEKASKGVDSIKATAASAKETAGRLSDVAMDKASKAKDAALDWLK